MSETYDYLKAAPVNVDALIREIEAEGLPSTEVVTWNEDETPTNLHITFASALSSGDETTLNGVVTAHTGDPWDYQPDEMNYYDKGPAIWTDSRTGISARAELMQGLISRRELFNDEDNPIHVPGFTPILGAGGWAEDHAARIANLENIHAELGWHSQLVKAAGWKRPTDLLIYYGWLNSFNSSVNGWDNEKVAQDLAKFGLIVLGDGIQDPSHGDYANTQVIIPRVKALNPSAKIFGYVTANQTLSAFEGKVDQWATLGVHGIFLDEAGYDYGKTRAEFNDRVDYVHGEGMVAFANAWNADHVLGTENDPSYPNSTYNSGEVESNLNVNDFILLESFGANDGAYTSTNGYEPKAQWAARGVKAIGLRATYGVSFVASCVIANSNSNGQDLADFAFIGSLMFSLDGYGSSDTNYGASSAAVDFWTRPDVEKMGKVWTLNPSVQEDVNDADVYHRFAERATMTLDFSDGAESSSISKW